MDTEKLLKNGKSEKELVIKKENTDTDSSVVVYSNLSNIKEVSICHRFTSIAVPATVLSAIISITNFFGAYILSLTGDEGVAASGLFSSLQLLLQSFIYSFLYIIGPLTGKITPGEPESSNESAAVFAYGNFLSLMLAVPMTIFYTFSEQFFIATGQNAAVSKIAGDAFIHYSWGCWADVALVATSQYSIAKDGPFSAIVFSFIQKTATLMLAYYLVISADDSAKMGAKGLGLSYSIFAIATYIAFSIYLFARKKINCINPRTLCNYSHKFKDLIKYGWPISLHMGSELAVLSWLMQMSGNINTQSLTATEIVCQYAGFSIAVIIGLSQGTSILISTLSENDTMVKNVMRLALVLSSMLSLIVGAFFILTPTQMTDVFLHHNSNQTNSTQSYSKDVNDISSLLFLVVAISNIPDNLRNIHTGALRGLMDTTVPMIANVAQSLISLGVAYVFLYETNMGATGLFVARGISIAALSGFLWHRWERKQKTCYKQRSCKSSSLLAVRNGNEEIIGNNDASPHKHGTSSDADYINSLR